MLSGKGLDDGIVDRDEFLRMLSKSVVHES